MHLTTLAEQKDYRRMGVRISGWRGGWENCCEYIDCNEGKRESDLLEKFVHRNGEMGSNHIKIQKLTLHYITFTLHYITKRGKCSLEKNEGNR